MHYHLCPYVNGSFLSLEISVLVWDEWAHAILFLLCSVCAFILSIHYSLRNEVIDTKR